MAMPVLGNFKTAGLLFANAGVVADVLLTRKLHEVKREISLAPARAPVVDHHLLHVAVEIKSCACPSKSIHPDTTVPLESHKG